MYHIALVVQFRRYMVEQASSEEVGWVLLQMFATYFEDKSELH